MHSPNQNGGAPPNSDQHQTHPPQKDRAENGKSLACNPRYYLFVGRKAYVALQRLQSSSENENIARPSGVLWNASGPKENAKKTKDSGVIIIIMNEDENDQVNDDNCLVLEHRASLKKAGKGLMKSSSSLNFLNANFSLSRMNPPSKQSKKSLSVSNQQPNYEEQIAKLNS